MTKPTDTHAPVYTQSVLIHSTSGKIYGATRCRQSLVDLSLGSITLPKRNMDTPQNTEGLPPSVL
jgi:hypothetical protein